MSALTPVVEDLWIAEGDGPMTESAAALGVTDDRMGRGLITFDYDNDGDLDVFVVNFAATPVLYRNDGALGNGWLRVRAVGSQSDSSGRGAQVRVRVSADGPELLRVIGEPTFDAFSTAWAVVSTASASRARRRCFSTVAGVNPIRRAMSWVVLPSPTHSRTSRWRLVRARLGGL